MSISQLRYRLTFLLLFASIHFLQAQSLLAKLEELAGTHDFTFHEMPCDTFFTEKYLLYVTQPLDHKHPETGSLCQRVYLSHRDFSANVVLITEGYSAGYAGHPRYINELSGLLGANQVCVEHRYFGESVPDTNDWQYLTVANSAGDCHRIAELLKELYSGPWVSTGISKGGQTAMFHRAYYPDDVTATVGYVCPLNFSIEDKRVYRFLSQVGDDTTRNRVTAFQRELIMNKELYLPEFERVAIEKGLTFSMGDEKGFELTVFEYSFAFWQWGEFSADMIPSPDTGKEKMIQHLHRVVNMSWVSAEGIRDNRPFFYQALREIGFYGYDISPFRAWVSYDRNPDFTFAAPDGLQVVYDPEPMWKVDRFIRHEAENMIFIYGENDPWTSTAVDLTYSNNLIKVVKPGGNHRTRIGNLPVEQQTLVMETLAGWLRTAE